MARIDIDGICCEMFISYSHEDSGYLQRLKKYIKETMFVRTKIFDDTIIQKGDLWENKIKQEIKTADIAILIISQSFVNSKFIQDEELPIILERFRNNQCRVLPILLEEYEIPDDLVVAGQMEEIIKIQSFITQNSLISRQPILKMLEEKVRENYYEILKELKIHVKETLRSKIQKMLKIDEDKSLEKIRRRGKRKVFVSMPSSDLGKKMLEEFQKYIVREKDIDQFEFDIIPGVGEVRGLKETIAAGDGSAKFCKNILRPYIDEAFCSIHIISNESELAPLDQAQIELAKELGLFQIYWYAQAPTVLSDRLVVGAKACLKLPEEIRSCEKKRSAEYSTLKEPLFSKNILLMHPLERGNDQELRNLSTGVKMSPVCDASITKYFNTDIIDNAIYDGGLMFFGSSLDLEWLAPRQKDILSTSFRCVYVSDPIESKRSDIEKLREIMNEDDDIIKGKNEMSKRVHEFLICLCLNKRYEK